MSKQPRLHRGWAMSNGRVACGLYLRPTPGGGSTIDIASKLTDITCLRCLAVILNEEKEALKEAHDKMTAVQADLLDTARQITWVKEFK